MAVADGCSRWLQPMVTGFQGNGCVLFPTVSAVIRSSSTRPSSNSHTHTLQTLLLQVRIVKEKSTGKIMAMKKLKKSEMVRRGQVSGCVAVLLCRCTLYAYHWAAAATQAWLHSNQRLTMRLQPSRLSGGDACLGGEGVGCMFTRVW